MDAGPFPTAYRKIVQEHIRTTFFDPYNIRDAQIAAPKISSGLVHIPNALGIGGTMSNVWVVCFRANAKNRTGAFTGISHTAVFISNNRVVNTVSGGVPDAGHFWCDGSAYEPFPDVAA